MNLRKILIYSLQAIIGLFLLLYAGIYLKEPIDILLLDNPYQIEFGENARFFIEHSILGFLSYFVFLGIICLWGAYLSLFNRGETYQKGIAVVFLISSLYTSTISNYSVDFSDFETLNIKKLYLQKADFENRLDTLLSQHGQQKNIPKNLQLPILVALSYYPELQNVPIQVYEQAIGSTMQARPEASTLFKEHRQRKYAIFINNSPETTTNIALESLSFNALVGWLGHELAHISDYKKRTSVSIIWVGISHLSPHFRSKYERFIDKLTILHGMGPSLYEGMEYVLEQSDATVSYINNLKTNYLSLQEIKKYSYDATQQLTN